MVDKPTGNSGTLRITDTGSAVEFWILCSDPATRVGSLPWSGIVNGQNVNGAIALPAGFGSRLVASYPVSTNQTVSFSIAKSGTSGLGGPSSVAMAISRQTVPPAPTTVANDQITSRSFRHVFRSNGYGGLPILRWETIVAEDINFSVNVRTFQSTDGVVPVPAEPDRKYYIADRGVNALGNGPWSATSTVTTVLDAPAVTGWEQSGNTLAATWTADPSSSLTGYRVQISTDKDFLSGITTVTAAASATSYAFGGLLGGRTYYVRLAAVTAAGASVWSAGIPGVLLILASGNLDGWSRFGAKPAALAYYTAEGIRRGVLGTRQALWLESYSTGAVTVPAGTLGIQRTIPTTPGRAYTVRLSIALGDGAGARTYRLEAPGITGDAVTITSPDAVPLPPLLFVASGHSSAIRVVLAEAINVPGETAPIEKAAIVGISVTEAAGDYGQRLRSTVYESDLASHFDLACNSVGAAWYADVTNVTRFSLPGQALPVSTMFSDRSTDGVLLYSDLDVGYDTRSMINILDATNHGIGEDGLAADDTASVSNPQSVSLYGPRKDSIDVNLYTLPPFDAAFNSRLAEILAAGDEPQLLIRSVTWNAQQNLAAAHSLELAQRVFVEFNGTTQDSQLIGLEHTITPTRWMVTARFLKL